MRRIVAGIGVVLAVAAFLFVALGSKSVNTGATYKIQLDNAFGLVSGSDFKVAGVIAGKITNIDLPQKCIKGNPTGCYALITVSVNQKGFGQFHSDAFCQSRPQSLIGEYFLDCQPGTQGPVLKQGATIPVSHTQSTIPADLVQNIMRLPYRERFSLIINELGAAVAGRSTDLQSALRRADPALAETDNLLALLASDNKTIRDLNVSANNVITALAQNNHQVQRFIVEANNTASESASSAANSSCGGSTQANCIAGTWNKLPGFLEQLRPAMQKLGAAADAQDVVFSNLNAASSNLNTFFHRLVPFSHQSAVSLGCGEQNLAPCPNGGSSLGTVSKTGKPAVIDAQPTVRDLLNFTGPSTCQSHDQALNRRGATTGFTSTCLAELAQNLAISLGWLDSRSHAVEPDPRSPGGAGYSGLEGLLQYVFNITNAINTFSSYGHELAVDAFANSVCSPYADPQSIANNLATYQKSGGDLNSFNPQNPRTCYAFLGPNQPGVTTTDPSNPSACVPDPGGYPVQGYGTHYYGARTNACKLQANPAANLPIPTSGGTGGGPIPLPLSRSKSATTGSGGGGGGSGGSTAQPGLSTAIGQIISGLGSGSGAATKSAGTTGTATTSAGSAGSTQSSSSGSSQAQQLLNYLLSP
jgi:phospholipid/cholesterol/gamma-HCH transport system substrate-binding protein